MPTVDALTIMSTSARHCASTASIATRQESAPRSVSASAAARSLCGSMIASDVDAGRRELAADRAARATRTEQRDPAPSQHVALALGAAHESRRRRTCRPSTCHRASRRSAFTAPMRLAVVPEPRRRTRTARALYGTVTTSPSRLPRPINARIAASKRSGSTCIGIMTAFMPAARTARRIPRATSPARSDRRRSRRAASRR